MCHLFLPPSSLRFLFFFFDYLGPAWSILQTIVLLGRLSPLSQLYFSRICATFFFSCFLFGPPARTIYACRLVGIIFSLPFINKCFRPCPFVSLLTASISSPLPRGFSSLGASSGRGALLVCLPVCVSLQAGLSTSRKDNLRAIPSLRLLPCRAYRAIFYRAHLFVSDHVFCPCSLLSQSRFTSSFLSNAVPGQRTTTSLFVFFFIS